MEDQDDIDDHNVNMICKENDDDVDCNKTQNMVKNEVIEEHNDENKKVKFDLNHDNVEARNPEDGVTIDEMNILLVVTTQDILEFQKVPREQIKTSLSDKEVSTLLVNATTYRKTISKHVEI